MESSYESYSTLQDSSTSGVEAAAAFGVLSAFFGFVLITAVFAYALNAIFLGMIFKKAGIESWKAWVPIYNQWIMLELGGQAGWWALLAFVPIANIAAAIFMYIAMYHIGLRLGKEGIFVLLAIFIPIVWLVWLAVDKSTWQGSQPSAAGTPPQTV